MPLHVYNTLTRRKEPFEPAMPGVVRIYTCGLTVYAPMHIGHARTYCFWDFFRRYLEYCGYHVVSVINYTDIDDRIMAKAEAAGVGSIDIAEANIAAFRRDCRLLHIKDYAAYTRATDFVAGQIELAAKLVELGHAYVVDGEVFYDVTSFPGYGKLSGRTIEEQQVGASGRVGEDFGRKRNPADFTLWKPSEPGQPRWETGHPDWPQGRPGWHLECSVMSTQLLGAHFDVHGGGVDNMFPHHENEIAQSEPVCGSPWVRYWLHPEHLDLRGEKMSKSLGNVIGIPEFVEHGVQAVRWFYATTHYRSKLPYSPDLLESSREGFSKLARLVRVLEEKLADSETVGAAPSRPDGGKMPPPLDPLYASQRESDFAIPRMRHLYTAGAYGEISAKFIDVFRAALDDDLNTPEAAAALFGYANELYAAGIADSSDSASQLAVYRCLTRHLSVLGVEYPNATLYPELAAECFEQAGGSADAGVGAVIDALLQQRQQARAEKDFAKSDLIRDMLTAAGVLIEDTATAPRWELKG